MPTIPAGLNQPRADISRFVVHLTRDDRDDFTDGGGTAFENFRAILDEQRILAVRSHCLHRNKLRQLDERQRRFFDVACFTATPLHELHHLTTPIEGRSHNFEPFGFVFSKQLLLEKGAQKAVYINGYGGPNYYRAAFDQVFETAVKTGFFGRSWRMLPFVSAMHGKYDFAWEREWRMSGHFHFDLSDLECVILPADKYAPLKRTLHERGIAVISPGWTYEQLLEELSTQKRTTRRILRFKKLEPTTVH
jgi:hypothetical protein